MGRGCTRRRRCTRGAHWPATRFGDGVSLERRPHVCHHAKYRLLCELTLVDIHHRLDTAFNIRRDEVKQLDDEAPLTNDGAVRSAPLARGVPDGRALREC